MMAAGIALRGGAKTPCHPATDDVVIPPVEK